MFHLGLDIGGTKIEAVLLDSHGEIQLRERRPTRKESYQSFIDNLIFFINEIKNKTSSEFTLGIGLPGTIDPVSGLIKNCNCLVLNGQDLTGDLTQHLKQPVFLANDADCFTLSEAVDGAGSSYNTVFGVIVGTGCGGGIVVNKKLLSGPNAITGEWGHNPLPGFMTQQDGIAQQCYCGQKNCVESFISGTGFAQRFNQQWHMQLSAEDIIAAAREKEPRALAHYHHFIDAFARSLAAVINTLDPHAIVIGGGLSNVASLYDDLPSVIREYIFSSDCRTTILKAKFGDSSGVRGAAWLPILQINKQI
ncbi:TPA: ROK family protein [Yersinia enterocolitica]|uniref:ROK family protein n=1 Tax=Yersinia enterocolitica TaxID=630 RepID=UPI0021E7F0FC|nr:ROK family protein [Yersinia enterocolitica]EKN5090020.1 ROK family protein [Yersinia enterocolitica]EKN5919053.1 ROK family protein [Yersinia enterocolitica]EKN6366163.1 ROK family protein [Yersinia enterocolitica]UYJ85218.1 ROK family protein [Yersinia enterocolitica]UYK14596.1 ROK family protein [Yersinia enterocolitica]